MLILDLGRPFQTPDGFFGVPHWPLDGVDANVVATRKVSGADQLYFGGTDGYTYLFDPAIYNEDSSAYTGTWTSKIFDLKTNWVLREYNVLGDELGDTDVKMYINADLQSGDGETATVNFQGGNDVLDTTFIIGTSILGGADFVYKSAGINQAGRFMQLTMKQETIDKRLVVEQVDLVLKDRGLMPNA
jgi:hypothetical protein